MRSSGINQKKALGVKFSGAFKAYKLIEISASNGLPDHLLAMG